MTALELLATGDEGIVVRVDGRDLTLSWRWLRDHARDETSYLAGMNQRLVGLGEVVETGPGAATSDGSSVTVSWPAGPTARFEASMLRALAGPRPDPLRSGPAWNRATIEDRVLVIDNGAVLTGEGRRRAMAGLCDTGVVLVVDVPLTNQGTRRVLERFGYVRTTIFGDVWEYGSQPDEGEGFDDTASSTLAISPHTDGTYSHDAPGLLALHCRRYDATGGENVFVDGRTIAARLAAEAPEDLARLQSIPVPGHYIGDGAHLEARRPPIRLDDDRLVQISFNNHDRAPFLLPEPTMTHLYDALHRLDRLAADPSLHYELALRPGEMVIFDNWRLLHGRRSLVGARDMAGGYINREDFESTVRLLG